MHQLDFKEKGRMVYMITVSEEGERVVVAREGE